MVFDGLEKYRMKNEQENIIFTCAISVFGGDIGERMTMSSSFLSQEATISHITQLEIETTAIIPFGLKMKKLEKLFLG